MAMKTDEDLKAELIQAQLAHEAANEEFLSAQDAYYSAGSPSEGALLVARNAAKAVLVERYNILASVRNEVLTRFMSD